MRTAWMLPATVLLVLFLGGRWAVAEGWPLGPLPADPGRPASRPDGFGPGTSLRAGPLERLGAGLEKVNAETKRLFSGADACTRKLFADANTGARQFFAGAKAVLTGQPAAGQRNAKPSLPWIRQPDDPRNLRQPKKKSWLDGLFGRREPKRVESMAEWVGLPRPRL